MYLRIALTISLILTCSGHGIKDSESLMRAMLNKYQGEWYQTLTFKQRTVRYDSTGEVISDKIWHEAMQMPDRLVIKFDDMEGGKGMLFRNDSLYQFRNGEVAGVRPMIHPLMVLGFSVYNQPIEKTISSLNALGFDFNKFHKREFKGKKVYVVGAEEGDETSNQFWIEKDRLLFVRSIQDFGNGRIQDIRFNNYQKLKGGWVATEVLFYAGDRVRLRETYTEVQSPELDPKIFEPDHFLMAKWECP